ncbi:MAG: hypothetical protein KJ574_04205 [Nanoarchaeota archaeon]|nr:hypothetical protein [Nanoarchaeota archaeon]
MKTETKKYIMLFLFGLSLILLILSSSAIAEDTLTTYITDAARLKISLISQDPDPAEPGSLVEVRWKVENLGSSNAQNVRVKILPEYPFSLLPGDDGLRDLGSIQGRQLDEEGVIIKYKLRVDEYAIEGDNTLRLEYIYDTNPWMKTDDYTLSVRTIDAALSVESVETSPEKIVPGTPAKVDIIIKNLADSYMQDITVKLDLTFSQYASQITSITDASSYFDALPFAPLKSTTEKRISRIAPGGTAIVSYDLMAYPDATSRIYKVPIIITYYDEVETLYTKNDVIGLVVGDVPDLDIILESSDVYAGGSAGTLTVKFVNKGITDIKFLNVQLLPNSDYEITSADTDYVGNVDSDDYETAEFKIFLKSSAKDKVSIPIKVMYKDANNNDYSKEMTLELKLLSAEERGVKQGSSLTLVIAILIILVVAWIVYKRWEKKKKAKASK